MEALDITSIIEAVLTLIIAVIGVIYTKARKESTNAEQLDKWVEIAVYAAEQAYKTGMTSDRKSYAKKVLEDKGFTVDWNAIDGVFDELDTRIEAAVNKMPSGGSYSYSMKGEVLDAIPEPEKVSK